VRKLRPDIALGADLIAGFPTETEKMFENSLSLVDECGLIFLHVFPYSTRAGTPAARMPQVHGDVIRERAAKLRQNADRRLSIFLSGEIGKTRNILVERNGLGRTEHYAPVALLGAADRGAILSAKIESFDGKRLSARAFREAA
jgi:threonylcarbamoyladenosine tRNA methylthiotransferase MtaB